MTAHGPIHSILDHGEPLDIPLTEQERIPIIDQLMELAWMLPNGDRRREAALNAATIIIQRRNHPAMVVSSGKEESTAVININGVLHEVGILDSKTNPFLLFTTFGAFKRETKQCVHGNASLEFIGSKEQARRFIMDRVSKQEEKI